jgi:hypothetical protein
MKHYIHPASLSDLKMNIKGAFTVFEIILAYSDNTPSMHESGAAGLYIIIIVHEGVFLWEQFLKLF